MNLDCAYQNVALAWKALPDSTLKILDTFGIFLSSLNLLLGIVSCALAVIQHQKMFKFPQVIVVYITISSIILEVFSLIAYGGGDRLFCTTKNYVEAIQNPSKFCRANGAIVYYIAIQLEIWWIFQVGMLFGKLMFPFKARSAIAMYTNDYVKGSRGVDYLPQLCGPSNRESSYFTILLATSVIQAVGVTLLWILTWNIIEERSIKRKDNKQQGRTVEVKLSIILLYHMLLAAMLFIAFGVFFANYKLYFREIKDYFVCEATGNYPGKVKCDRSKLDSFAFPILFNLLIFMLVSNPSVTLIYIVSWTDVRRLCRRFYVKYQTKSTESTIIEIETSNTSLSLNE